MRRKALVLLSVLAILLGLGGCGDDGGSDENTLTKAEFIKQGDRVCRESAVRAEAEVEKFASENDLGRGGYAKEELEETATEFLVPSLNRQAKGLEELGAPEGDEERVEAIVVSFEDAASEIEDEPGLVLEGEVLKESAELAEDYGFKVCGEG